MSDTSRARPAAAGPLVGALLAVLAGCASAPPGPTLDLIAFGPIELDAQASAAAAGSARADGARQVLKPARQAEVVARLGTQFGLAYTFRSVNLGRRYAVREVWQAPAPGLRDANSGVTSRQRTSEQVCQTDRTCFTLQRFEQPADLLPGTWTVEVWYEGQRVLEQAFEVTLP